MHVVFLMVTRHISFAILLNEVFYNYYAYFYRNVCTFNNTIYGDTDINPFVTISNRKVNFIRYHAYVLFQWYIRHNAFPII